MSKNKQLAPTATSIGSESHGRFGYFGSSKLPYPPHLLPSKLFFQAKKCIDMIVFRERHT